jgi:predicted transposase YdaD
MTSQDYTDILLGRNSVEMVAGFSYNSPTKIAENMRLDNMTKSELIQEVLKLRQQLQMALREIAELRQQNEQLFAILKRNGLI